MRSIPALIVIIIAIVAIIIVIGFVVASITHKYTGEDIKTENVVQVENIPELDQKIYALQLFASNKFSRVEHQKQKLEKQGYDTNVLKTLRDGEVLYRLRLDGLYGENEAIALGEEIKKKFPSIQNYWLDQVGLEKDEPMDVAIVEETKDKVEEKPEIEEQPNLEQNIQTSEIGEKNFEVQLMASSNYAKIEVAKGALSRLGYQTKIVNKTEGTKVVYRLRLKDLYTKSSAIALGEKIINDSPLISGYWLDQIKNGVSVPNQQHISKTTEPVQTITKTNTNDGSKIYEIQLLANTKIDLVEKRKRDLEKKGYRAKILSVVVKGKTYYRLRLAESYTQSNAKDIGDILKKNVSFVKDYWIVKKSATDKIVTTSSRTAIEEKPVEETKKIEDKTESKEERLPVETDVSANPKYKANIVDYSASCNANEVIIRSGPGSHFEIDPIGKLMQGITVFAVEEKNGWARFTITPNDESWSGWVKLEYLDKN